MKSLIYGSSVYPRHCSLPGSSAHGVFQARILDIGVGYHILSPVIFLTQGSNLRLFHLLHWQANTLPLCHLGSPWVQRGGQKREELEKLAETQILSLERLISREEQMQ